MSNSSRYSSSTWTDVPSPPPRAPACLAITSLGPGLMYQEVGRPAGHRLAHSLSEAPSSVASTNSSQAPSGSFESASRPPVHSASSRLSSAGSASASRGMLLSIRASCPSVSWSNRRLAGPGQLYQDWFKSGSVESACEVFGIAEERGISWAGFEPLTNEEAHRLFYPDRGVRESVFEDPAWGYIHKEMGKVSVSLHLLHDEYREEVLARGQGRDELHEVLRRLRSLDDREQPHQAHRAQGGAVARGRLVGPHLGRGW